MSSYPAPATKSPCGGGGHAGAPACGCGKTDCGGCSNGELVRPRFFAGQLLTEEDLELLTTYVTAKSRLHNRHLHGAGVVCGLEVTCDPCGSGRVTVQPGHALDCCGNDIVVPCATELDVNEMVRRLRIESLGGHDCGDPCAEPRKGASGKDGKEEDRPAGRRYCLWLEYCEEGSEPVAPYVTGEPCGERPCEASRVREGYHFTLRCPAPEKKPDNLFDRIRACFDDLAEAEKAVSDVQAYDHLWSRHAEAQAALDRGEPIVFGIEEQEALGRATDELEERVGKLAQRVEKGEGRLEEAEIRAGLDTFHETARLVVLHRLAAAPADVVPGVAFAALSSGARGRVDEDLGSAIEAIHQAEPLLGKGMELSIQRDKVVAEAVVQGALAWTDPDLQVSGAQVPEMVRYAYGAVTSPKVAVEASRDLRQLREWLLCRLDGARLTDCRLRGEAESLRVPEATSDATAFSESARRLLRLVVRYLLDCVCAALNPPCPPCDDPAVLLACLEVEDCEVVEICNLERTWVLSAVALRYWVPLLRWIGEGLETLCCELRHDIAVPRSKDTAVAQDPSYPVAFFRNTCPLSGGLRQNEGYRQVLRFTGIRDATAASAINLAGSFRSIAVASSLAPDLRIADFMRTVETFRGEVPAGAEELAGEELMEEVVGRLGAVFEEPAVEEMLEEAIEERMAALVERPEVRESLAQGIAPAVAERVEGRMTEALGVVEERAAENAATVSKLERMVKSRFTMTELKRSEPIKELKGADAEIKRMIRELEKANEALQGRLDALEKEREA